MATYIDAAPLAGTGHVKPGKSRSKAVVKPILKKMGSQSAKSSLDLDRSWEEQIHYGSHGWGATTPTSIGTGNARGTVGVGWGDGDNEGSVYGGAGDDTVGRLSSETRTRTATKYSHARSTSGASHASIATSGSGPGAYRNGSFIHPFQQTPRTSTPPLSYANSFASFDQLGGTNSRDYSPTITEDEDLELSPTTPSSYNYIAPINTSGSGNPTSAPRRPSLGSHRTSSLSDVNSQQPLRVSTSNRSTSISGGSRLAQITSNSDLNFVSETDDSSAVLKARAASHPTTTTAEVSSSPSLMSPSSPTNSTMSPFRTSLEGFRLRSRSEVDPTDRMERIRQERQKWEERERAKDRKRSKGESKRRGRADAKQAHKIEREQAHFSKEVAALSSMESKGLWIQPSSSGLDSPVAALDLDEPEASPPGTKKIHVAQRKQKKLQPRSQSNSPSTMDSAAAEKFAYSARDPGQQSAAAAAHGAQGVSFHVPKRASTKRKTQGAWTSFMLWFRTRILRLQTKLEM